MMPKQNVNENFSPDPPRQRRITFVKQMLKNLMIICYQKLHLLKKTVVIVLAVLSLSYSVHPGRFACNYTYIQDDDIVSVLGPSPSAVLISERNGLPLCSDTYNSSVTRINYPEDHFKYEDFVSFAKKMNVSAGGKNVKHELRVKLKELCAPRLTLNVSQEQ